MLRTYFATFLIFAVSGFAHAADQKSDEFYLEIQAKQLGATDVRLEIGTNLPLPVEVMVGVDLADQKPNDVWIGASKRIWLRELRTVYILDTSGKQLPSGTYEANVTFYKRWGASNGNPEAAKAGDLEATRRVLLRGTGASAEAVKRKNELQRWTIETIYMGYPWNESKFVGRLGDYEISPADLNLHDAYYFPDADMTLLVNRKKKTITVWRMGRAKK